MKTTVINKYILLYNSIYSTRFYGVMWHQILYFLQNLVIILLLLANKERSSSERLMEGGIADKTSMTPLKCECFWLGCLRTTTVVGTHGLDRFLDERKISYETRK